MVGDWALNGRRIYVREACAALLLCFGLCTFALADKASSPNFSLLGVGCTIINLCGSSLVANLQQKALQGSEKKRNSAAEQEDLVFWQYLIAALICFAISQATGELSQGIVFLSRAPLLAHLNLLGYLVGGYLGLQPLLRIFQEYDATRGHVVTSLRKVITFATSFIVFPKPLTSLHIGGALASALGGFMLQRLRDRKPVLPERIVPPFKRNTMSRRVPFMSS
jgi:drug/metabolite transporter (DMT)-like permease